MWRVTLRKIEEMRSRGYDPPWIELAEQALARGKLADQLIDQIAEAFQGVTLGEGIGLQEGQGIDDWEDEATCAAYWETDEKDDWRKIDSERLNRCSSSLSFFDPEAMRFHLPAFMTAELRGEYEFGLAFNLTYLEDYNRSKFSALTPGQRNVVREFLLLIRDDINYQFETHDIDRALAEFWTRTESKPT